MRPQNRRKHWRIGDSFWTDCAGDIRLVRITGLGSGRWPIQVEDLRGELYCLASDAVKTIFENGGWVEDCGDFYPLDQSSSPTMSSTLSR
jgi:hypothetical protein